MQGIVYIKAYFIIDSGSLKCYLGTLITNLQLFYIRMGQLLSWQDKAAKSLPKSFIFYQVAVKAKK